jgi:transcription antitermination factor NusG
MLDMEQPLPEVVADLTFSPLRHGLATVPPGIWEEDRDPVVGERVAVSDGGAGPFEAVITDIDPDGTLVLKVEAFVPSHA